MEAVNSSYPIEFLQNPIWTSAHDKFKHVEFHANELTSVDTEYNPFDQRSVGSKRKLENMSDSETFSSWAGLETYFDSSEQVTKQENTYEEPILLSESFGSVDQIVDVKCFEEIISANALLLSDSTNSCPITNTSSVATKPLQYAPHPNYATVESISGSTPNPDLTIPTTVSNKQLLHSAKELRKTISTLENPSKQMFKDSLVRLAQGTSLCSMYSIPNTQLTADQAVGLSHDIFTLHLILGIPMYPQTHLPPPTLEMNYTNVQPIPENQMSYYSSPFYSYPCMPVNNFL